MKMCVVCGALWQRAERWAPEEPSCSCADWGESPPLSLGAALQEQRQSNLSRFFAEPGEEVASEDIIKEEWEQ